MSTAEPRPFCWDSGGLSLHAAEWGEPAAPLVVLHHGWLDQCRSWDAVAAPLSQRFRVVVPDARGHGDSEWVGAGGTYYFPDYLLDLHRLLDALGAEKPVALVGHSMGGSVVGYFAGAFPARVSHLALLEGFGPPTEPPDLFPARLAGFVKTVEAARREPEVMASLEDAVRRLRRADSLLTEPVAAHMALHATRPVPGGIAWKADPLHKARSGGAFVLEHAMALWRRIECPVLSLDGERTAFRWPDLPDRRAAVRGLQHHVVPGAGHNLHAHAPSAVVAHLLGFLGDPPG